ncbi:MAG: hypothetical protein DDT34_01536 [Firmicutes bacterium]|nr:hypothetical protein [candidate division NPL-UPA2 bacterium]MBT9136455.1 hypothetical protein [Bacillota bacterium]
MEGLLDTVTNNLTSFGLIAVGGYAIVKLVGDYEVWSTHRKLMTWGHDRERIKRTSGADTLKDFFMELPSLALESPTHLAIEVAAGANMAIRGRLSDASIARLGTRLQKSWDYLIRIEKERRRAGSR